MLRHALWIYISTTDSGLQWAGYSKGFPTGSYLYIKLKFGYIRYSSNQSVLRRLKGAFFKVEDILNVNNFHTDHKHLHRLEMTLILKHVLLLSEEK